MPFSSNRCLSESSPLMSRRVDGVMLRFVRLDQLHQRFQVKRLTFAQLSCRHQPVDHLQGVLVMDIVLDCLRRHEVDNIHESSGQVAHVKVSKGGHTLILPFAFAVRLVGQDRPNVHELVIVTDAGDETIFVSTDVEHGQVSLPALVATPSAWG